MSFDRTDQQVKVTTNGGGAYTVFGYDAYGNLLQRRVGQLGHGDDLRSRRQADRDRRRRHGNDTSFAFDALGRFRTRVLGGGTSTDTYGYAGTAETVLRISNSAGPT